MIQRICIGGTGVSNVLVVVQHLFRPAEVYHVAHTQNTDFIKEFENVRTRLVNGKENQFTSARDVPEV